MRGKKKSFTQSAGNACNQVEIGLYFASDWLRGR